MTVTAWERARQLDTCPGCHDDRYNHPGTCERPGIDAPVTSVKCWHLERPTVHYDRQAKRFVCAARIPVKRAAPLRWLGGGTPQ